MDSNLEIIGEEWRLRARELAEWAANSLAVRGEAAPSLESLVRHFEGQRRDDLMAFNSLGSGDKTQYFVTAFDQLENHGEESGRKNFEAALGWCNAFRAGGYDPLLFDIDGCGKYQILILFSEPAGNVDVTSLVDDLVSNGKPLNLDSESAMSPVVTNTLILPGLHRSLDHFSRVWDGGNWQSGNAAIDIILSAKPGAAPKPVKKKAVPQNKFRNVCIDLDGVLARHGKWQGIEHFGDPIDGAIEFTRQMSEKYRVIIFSARTHEGESRDANEAAKLVEAWLDSHGFAYDEIYTGSGKPFAIAYIDDRGVSCCPQEDGPRAFELATMQVEKLAGVR